MILQRVSAFVTGYRGKIRVGRENLKKEVSAHVIPMEKRLIITKELEALLYV